MKMYVTPLILRFYKDTRAYRWNYSSCKPPPPTDYFIQYSQLWKIQLLSVTGEWDSFPSSEVRGSQVFIRVSTSVVTKKTSQTLTVSVPSPEAVFSLMYWFKVFPTNSKISGQFLLLLFTSRWVMILTEFFHYLEKLWALASTKEAKSQWETH